MRPFVTKPAALALLILAGAAGLSAIGRAQDEPKQGSRTAFMRQKLEFSKDLLEGLTVEDFDKISKAAKDLKVLSNAALWEVPTVPNLQQYVPLTTEFQRFTDEVAAAAGRKNIDAATVAYLRLTTNCVACHKYVREIIK